MSNLPGGREELQFDRGLLRSGDEGRFGESNPPGDHQLLRRGQGVRVHHHASRVPTGCSIQEGIYDVHIDLHRSILQNAITAIFIDKPAVRRQPG
jgi:hypothetical protein